MTRLPTIAERLIASVAIALDVNFDNLSEPQVRLEPSDIFQHLLWEKGMRNFKTKITEFMNLSRSSQVN